jgi:poly(3-hydroxyalkanoate) depolymerase
VLASTDRSVTVEERVVRTEFLMVNDLRLRVRRSGAGSPVLLIMGLGGCIETWTPLAESLTGLELILVDHPGMGLSSVPRAPIPMPGLADLYARLLGRLGYDRVHVVGYSFGGTVAQQLAVSHPTRVDRLALLATGCGWGGVPASPLTLAAGALPARFSSPAFRAALAPVLYAGRAARDPSVLRDLRPRTRRPSMTGIAWQLAAYSSWSSLPWLHRLRQPTLVLAGDEDPMAPVANARLIAARIPGARLHIVAGGGHLFPFDQAGEAVPVLHEFLSREHVAAAS